MQGELWGCLSSTLLPCTPRILCMFAGRVAAVVDFHSILPAPVLALVPPVAALSTIICCSVAVLNVSVAVLVLEVVIAGGVAAGVVLAVTVVLGRQGGLGVGVGAAVVVVVVVVVVAAAVAGPAAVAVVAAVE